MESLLVEWASIRAKRLTAPDTDIDNNNGNVMETLDNFLVELGRTKILGEAPSRKEALTLSEPAGWYRLTEATAAEHAG